MLHVVEVQHGNVISLFPFDGERQSMLWVDAILLSNDAALDGISNDITSLLSASDSVPLYAYSVIKIDNHFQLKRL